MAAIAGAELNRPLNGLNVRFLVENKLVPAGLLTTADMSPALAPATAPDTRLLALRFRRAIVSQQAMQGAARLLGPLFRPAVVVAVLAGVLAVDIWAFGAHGAAGTVGDVARSPGLLVLVLALISLSGAFHELGHAAGCCYSGGRPGVAGVGLYLIWPVFYTNVTDAYRLDRRGRLRTDLGGIYFNAIFILASGGAYAATGYEPLLAVIVLEHFLVLQQLMPWGRLDGYYIVSDLTGVPDIFSRVRPALRSLIPGRPAHPDFAALRPGARRILYAYLVSLVAFVALAVVPALLLLPATLAATGGSMLPHLRAMRDAAGQWDTIMVVARAAAMAVLALPVVGLTLTIGLIFTRLGRRPAGAVQQAVRRRRRHRDPLRRRLEASDLAIVEGMELPGGGAVDYFGFGPGGEIVLFGIAGERPPHEVASRLVLAAGALTSLSADELDRLLPERPPGLDATLARGDFALLVLRRGRLGATMSVQSVSLGANCHKTEKMPRIGTSAR